MKRLAIIGAVLSMSALASVLVDARYGPIERDPDGRLSRSAQVLRDFQQLHPCPATGSRTGACPGWAKDHVIPRACGGKDTIENLQWLPTALKSCAGTLCKDRWERKIYCKEPT